MLVEYSVPTRLSPDINNKGGLSKVNKTMNETKG